MRIEKDKWQFKIPEGSSMGSAYWTTDLVPYVRLVLTRVSIAELFELRRQGRRGEQEKRGMPTYIAFGPTHGYLFPTPDKEGNLTVFYTGPVQEL